MGASLLGERLLKNRRRLRSSINCVVEARGFNESGRVVWKVTCVVKKVGEKSFLYVTPEKNPL